MKDGKTWHAVETGSGQIEVIADANHVGIRIVGVKNWIPIRAVAIVRDPDLRNGCLCRGTKRDKSDQKGQAEVVDKDQAAVVLHFGINASETPSTQALKIDGNNTSRILGRFV